MLDGRIDVQGTVKELRQQNILDSVINDANAEPSTSDTDSSVNAKEKEEEIVEGGGTSTEDAKVKKPRKLIKDEERETGGVKWVIYKTYLKASCVQQPNK